MTKARDASRYPNQFDGGDVGDFLANKGTAAVADILGTVSQSGGTPTGAIIERGSNSNGEYVKYADGTMICSNNDFVVSGGVTSASGSVFKSANQTWAYPEEFITRPVNSGKPQGGLGSRWLGLGSAADTNGIDMNFAVFSGSSSTTDEDVMLFAIGRWF